MNVVLLCATSARTGVEAHLVMLARGLVAQGVTPRLVCSTDGPLVDDFRGLGFEVRRAAPGGRLGGLALAGLERALADATVVHAHGPRAIFWSAQLRTVAPRRAAVATVHQFHASGPAGGLARRAMAALETWSIRRHDRVIAVSPEVRERLAAARALPADRCAVIPHTVPLLAERPLLRRTAEATPPRALVAARLDPVKGIDLLLEAWGRLKQAGVELPLAILGDGPERTVLVARARQLGLAEFVRFEGIVGDVPARLEASAVYVAPSRYESLGGAVLEAMAVGLPVIASDVPGHRFLLGETAPDWLVPAEDPAAFAAAVRRLLALEPAARLALGARLQERAYAAFAPSRVVAGTLEVYRRALGG